MNPPAPRPAQPVAHPRDLSDEQLLAQCRFEAFRGSGPGGQKRNKTSSAARITHESSGLSSVAGESRSQHENRRRALQRLRHRIALELRMPVGPERFDLPPWLLQGMTATGSAASESLRLTRLSLRHEKYLQAVGVVLDLLTPLKGSVSATAARLGVSTADFVAFLQRDEKLLAHVNHVRKGAGLKPLGGV